MKVLSGLILAASVAAFGWYVRLVLVDWWQGRKFRQQHRR